MQAIDLAKLRPGHPRLIILDSDIERVKKLIATDPQAQKYRDNLVAAGEKLLADPKTVEYKLIGPRLLDQSRKCLDRIYTLAALWRLEGEMKWVERAKKELLAAAAFPDWNPSHFLDVAEMSHAFAIGYDWLHGALSASERATIKTALVEKGLKRGEEAYQGTKPWKWWTTAHHNWNQVCNGGMTIAALAVADEEPQLATFILKSAQKSLPHAMASFGPDGGWNEGPGYWSYTVRYTVAGLPIASISPSTTGRRRAVRAVLAGRWICSGMPPPRPLQPGPISPSTMSFVGLMSHFCAPAGATKVPSGLASRVAITPRITPTWTWEPLSSMRSGSAG